MRVIQVNDHSAQSVQSWLFCFQRPFVSQEWSLFMTPPSRPDDLTLLTFGIVGCSHLSYTLPDQWRFNNCTYYSILCTNCIKCSISSWTFWDAMLTNKRWALKLLLWWRATGWHRLLSRSMHEPYAKNTPTMPLCGMDEDRCTGRLEGETLRWARRTKAKVAKSRHRRSLSLCLLSPWGLVHTLFMLSTSAITRLSTFSS